VLQAIEAWQVIELVVRRVEPLESSETGDVRKFQELITREPQNDEPVGVGVGVNTALQCGWGYLSQALISIGRACQ